MWAVRRKNPDVGAGPNMVWKFRTLNTLFGSWNHLGLSSHIFHIFKLKEYQGSFGGGSKSLQVKDLILLEFLGSILLPVSVDDDGY